MTTLKSSPLFRVRVKDLIVDHDLNPRFRANYEAGNDTPGYEQAGLRELGVSLRSGQLQNICVDKDAKSGKWRVRAGFRRVEAAKLEGIEWLDAKEIENGAIGALAENIGRKNLLPVEVVFALRALLSDPSVKLTHEQIGERASLSRSAVTNYATIAKKVHPRILESWRARPGLFTVQMMLQCAPLPPAKQLAWLHQTVGGVNTPDSENGKSAIDDREPRQVSSVSSKALQAMRERLDAGKLDHRGAEWCEGASAVLEALLSGRTLK